MTVLTEGHFIIYSLLHDLFSAASGKIRVEMSYIVNIVTSERVVNIAWVA